MIRLDSMITKAPGQYNLFIDSSCKDIPDTFLRIFHKNRSYYVFNTITLYEIDLYPKWFWQYIRLVVFDQKEEIEFTVEPSSKL